MWRTCGRRPPGPFASSAARWRTPKRCCSSTTATARERTRPPPRSARVCRRRAGAGRRRVSRAALAGAPGVAEVSSVAGTGSAASSVSSVRKCCSASVSVGAISAAWCPASIARSIAKRPTTVLPEPTSPISSRCIGCDWRGPHRSPRLRGAGRPSARTGSEPTQDPTDAPRSRQLNPALTRDAAPPAGDQRRLVEEELLECQSLPGRLGGVLIGGKCDATSASWAARHAELRRSRPGTGSTAWRAWGIACHTHSRIRCGRSRSLAGCTGTTPVVCRPAGVRSHHRETRARRR